MITNFHQANKLKLSILAVSLSLVLSGCETEEEVAEGHLEKGIELLKKGDYAAAQLELKSAKKGSKSTADTYYYLALLDEKAKHYLAMQDNLQKTLDLEPGHQQARIKLGKLELLMGNMDKANEHVEVLLTKNAQDSEALNLKASVLLKQQKKDEALAIINHILELDPVNIEGLSLQAMILAQQEQLAEALLVINKAIELDEKNLTLHFFKIKTHGQQQDVEAITNDYLTLIALYPDNDSYKITLARIYTQTKKLDKAEKVLRDLVVAEPSQIKPKILLLEFLRATKNDKVDRQIEEFTQQLAKQPKQLFGFAKWMLAKGNMSGATELLKQVVTTEGYSKTGVEANILLAKIAFDTRDYPATKKIVADILQEVPDELGAKLLQARLLLVKEEYTQAKAYLDKIIWTHPKSDEALVLLAQFYLVQGDRSQAFKKFKGALNLNPGNLQAFTPVYNDLIAKNDGKYARQILLKALRKKPQQTLFLKKLIELNISEERWQEATQVTIQLAKIPKQKNQAKFYLANIFQGQSECEKSVVLYKELIREFPGQIRVLQAMSACYKTLDKQSEMIGFLHEQLDANKDNIAATIVLSDLYVAEKKYKSAIKLLNTLIEKQPGSVLVRRKLAKIYLTLGESNKALSVYQQGLQVLPGNIRLSLALTSLYEKQKLYAEAVKIYEQLHRQNPDLQVVNNNLAVLLVEHFATDDNLQRALQLVDSFAESEQAYYQDTYAWVLLHTGQISDALDLLKKLIIKAPDVPVFRYHLGVAEFENGDNSRAFAQVSQAIELAKQGKSFSDRELAEKLIVKIANKMQGR
ncbi:MAG: tetratricopeptide repeat protein [Methyloprofundus sp.]|nr:tetratricopeptide repeat protein [Methyloprofundus sp.]